MSMPTWFKKALEGLGRTVKGGLAGAVAGIPGGLPGIIGGGITGGAAGATAPLWETPAQDEQSGMMAGLPPEMQEQFKQYISQLLDGLNGNQFDFGPIREDAMANFHQKTVPSIMERLNGLGGGGYSSAFANQLGEAGAGLERGLAADQQGYNLQQQGMAQNMLGLASQSGNYRPGTPGTFDMMVGKAMEGGGNFMSGPGGAEAMKKGGDWFSSLMGGGGNQFSKVPKGYFQGKY